ncbi:unnamed protein product [Linum tenue]|uniref:Secreted protein n=1 Tax=Linum tenue TaxID=586396 RepID=A0AAV0R024_9ROSI|nr:unnamed protein product [Linum tenue]
MLLSRTLRSTGMICLMYVFIPPSPSSVPPDIGPRNSLPNPAAEETILLCLALCLQKPTLFLLICSQRPKET